MTQEGRDVSVWQGAYGFPAVDFTIAKATEGIGYRDPQWSRNQSILLQPGAMVAGSYHFFRGNPNEVDWYLSQHDSRCFAPDMPWIFCLDAEAEGDAGAVNQFLARLKARIGYDPWFYSYGGWIQARPGIDRSYPLWIAAPSSPVGQPPGYGWAAVTAHQYGTVNSVDANQFLGERAALLKLAGMGSSQPSAPARSYDVPLIVQRQADTPDAHGLGSVYSFDFMNKVYIADGKLAEWATQFNPPPFTGKLIPMPGVFLDRYEEEAGILINQSKPAFDPSGFEAKLDKVLARLEQAKT